MIRVLICDDDKYTAMMLEKVVSENPFIDDIVKFYDGQEAAEYVKKDNAIDIALLDVDMPKLDGIELAKIIYDLSPQTKIIFVTAYSEYAVDSFSVRPFDYILKPIDIERVKEDINNIVVSMDTESFNTFLDSTGKILVKSSGAVHFLDMDDINFIEKQEKVTLFHTKDGIYTSYTSLQKIEQNLSKNFYRVHRCYLINLKTVEKIKPFSDSSYNIHFKDYDETALITKAKYQIMRDSVL